jgi:hypothetical protein
MAIDANARALACASLSWLVGVALSGAGVAACDAGGAAFGHAAPRTTGTSSGADGSAGCEEGEARVCHVALGEHAGVTSCFEGVATCRAGAFGACEAADPGGLATPLDLALPAADAGGCADDPCDPYCQAVASAPDGGLAPRPAADGGAFVGGSVSSLPGGFANKGLKDASHPPNQAPCGGPADCQFDYRCLAGACVPWTPGGVDTTCLGADLTAGVPCGGLVPVCNRGTATAPAGVVVAVFSGNSAQLQGDLGLCSGASGALAGSCTTPAPIAPGACIPVPDCPIDGGTRAIVVNPSASYGLGAPVPECQCGNDWTVSAGGACGQSPAGFVATKATETITATCPPGARPQWGFLTFSATVPSDASGASRLRFRARAANTAAGLAAATSVLLADVPTTVPPSCGMGGPAPCPVDVFAALGGLPAAAQPALALDLELDPAPDGLVGPTLASWKVTYSCAPSE